jgi:hypothetical protein
MEWMNVKKLRCLGKLRHRTKVNTTNQRYGIEARAVPQFGTRKAYSGGECHCIGVT